MNTQNKHKKEVWKSKDAQSFEEWFDITLEETFTAGIKQGIQTALDAVEEELRREANKHVSNTKEDNHIYNTLRTIEENLPTLLSNNPQDE